jgi:hypothetical protein
LEHHDHRVMGLTIRPGRTGGMGGGKGLGLLPLPAHLLSRCAIRNRPAVRHAGSMPAAPARSTGLALAFHTLLSFQGTSRKLFGDSPAVPASAPTTRAAATLARAFRARQTSASHGTPAEYPVHRRHFRQKRRPAPCHRASGRPPQAVERGPEWPPATSCLPLSTSYRRQSCASTTA